ncbi:transcriptional regulator, LysR family [Methylocella silvestris BL2]|uniref:Transcriptional regulator, LysR family n=1 Tax=Methylocella silvestris (strain DSM 15510 / CIP 108128 / LMG 27833 / NCIMB 13906 / BL2) TaxID=395965 RepID=B8EQA8_METSB|nr:LysR family transcriptional regulator [Methylocella silvestris]ACK51598.1 transcriptional regulator, LysR family [Methylocella silvestris BL2]
MTFDARLLSGVGVLIAVVETGSFVRAGEKLGLSDSGVSRAIARLEARLGVRLLDRTTRALRLTDDGRRFHAEATPLLLQLADAAAELGAARANVRGRLRVEVDPFFSRLALAPRLGAFLDRYPDLTLELITTEAPGDLVARGFDLAIRFGEPRAGGLIARKLLDTRILTVASPRYIERNGRPAQPRDLVRHRCIQYRDPASGRPFAWEFRKGRKIVPVEVEGPLTVSDVGTMLQAATAGVGVAQVMALGSEALLESGALVELFPDWPDETFPLHAFYPSRHQPSLRVRALIDFCLELGVA